MLIRITNRCSMGCRHCLTDSSPDNNDHMSIETLTAALRFTRMFDFGIVMLSGGEPTEHPAFLDMLHQTMRFDVHTVLLTNGLWLHEDDKRRDTILNLVGSVQVTNDDRYYPQHVGAFDHPKVTFVRQIQQLACLGRAAKNRLPCDRISPYCFNLRSLTIHYNSFTTAILELRHREKFCTPSVNVNGDVVAGEAIGCAWIGNVKETDDLVIRNRIKILKCNRCGICRNLAPELAEAIGEGDPCNETINIPGSSTLAGKL